jgi:hypothetical protein
MILNSKEENVMYLLGKISRNHLFFSSIQDREYRNLLIQIIFRFNKMKKKNREIVLLEYSIG